MQKLTSRPSFVLIASVTLDKSLTYWNYFFILEIYERGQFAPKIASNFNLLFVWRFDFFPIYYIILSSRQL